VEWWTPFLEEKMAEYMESLIGLPPGEASVMGILNDPEGKVQVVIDKAVADAEWFACNPGANTTHIRFKTKQLIIQEGAMFQGNCQMGVPQNTAPVREVKEKA